MHLKALRLTNFRNYSNLSLEFPGKYNLITGANGQGKTNLLEAIYFSSRFNSFRTSRSDSLIRENCPEAKIGATFTEEGEKFDLDLSINSDQKQLNINNKKISSQKNHKRKFLLLFFSNEDIMLASGSPAHRREYFDAILSLLSTKYSFALSNYKKIIRNRNKDLKLGNNPDRWDETLIKFGYIITGARNSFLKAVKSSFEQIFDSLFDNNSLKPEINYVIKNDQNWLESGFDKKKYEELLKNSRDKDRLLGLTSFGPHKDDFRFTLSDKILKNFASQGQVRLFIYSLKLAVYKYIAKSLRKKPILLIDDVFADLDDKRVSLFFDYIKSCNQVFIACANSNIISSGTMDYNKFIAHNGMITGK